MKLLVRIIGYGPVVVVALIVAGAAVLLSTDTDEIEAFLTEQVKTATGRSLTFKGGLAYSLSFNPVVTADGVVLSNAGWGSRPDMIRLKRLEVGLQLLPLLRGELRLSRLALIEPDIWLETDAQGRANWVFEQPGGPPDADATGGWTLIPILEIFDVTDGRITYRDARTGTTRTVSLENLRLSSAGRGDEMTIGLKAASKGVPVALTGKIGSLYALLDDPSSYDFSLQGRVMDATFSAVGAIRQPRRNPQFKMDLAVAADDVGRLISGIRKFAPVLPSLNIPPAVGLKVSATIGGSPSKFSAENIEVALGSAQTFRIGVKGEVRDLMAPEGVNLALTAAGDDLRQAAQVGGVALSSGPAYRLAGRLRSSSNAYNLDELEIKLGESTVSARGSLARPFSGANPELQLAVTSAALKMTELRALPPKLPAGPAAPDTSDGRIFSGAPFDLKALKTAALSLKFTGRDMRIDDLSVETLSFWLRLKDGALDVDPLSGRFGGNRLDGSVAVDTRPSIPTGAVQLKIDAPNLGRLLRKFDVTKLLNGRAKLEFNLNGRGASVRALMAGLNGSSELIVDEGRVASQYLDYLATDLMTELLPWAKRSTDTRINCVVSRFDFTDGIATSKGLLVDTDKVVITGGGRINLKDESLDLRIDPRPKERSLVSLAFPVDIKGTLAAPRPAPTPRSLVKGIAGLALGIVNPLGLLLATGSGGDDAGNRCVAALARAAKQPAAPGTVSEGAAPAVPTAEPSETSKSGSALPNPIKNPLKAVEKAVKGIGSGIGNTLKSIFGKKTP